MSEIVERLEHLAHCDAMFGKGSSAKIIREGIAEIKALRRRIALHKEKLPDPTLSVAGRALPINGHAVPDWRNLPEAP